MATGETDVTMMWDEAAVPEEHADWHRSNDGLLGFGRAMLVQGAITEAEVIAIDDAIRAEIDNAVRFALDSPYPAPSEALADVFA